MKWRPRPPLLIHKGPLTLDLVKEWLPFQQAPVSYDYETNGIDPYAPGARRIGIGIASERGCVYLDLREIEDDALDYFKEWLTKQPTIAFNAVFDQAWSYALTAPRIPNLAGCSLIMYRCLANDGFYGQRWDLGSAQSYVLGWKDINKTWLKDSLSNNNIAKADMWKLADIDHENFGRYCALDAEASYQLWFLFQSQYTQAPYDVLWKHHKEYHIPALKATIEQQQKGLKVNAEKLKAYQLDLTKQAVLLEGRIRNFSPEIRDWINQKEQELTIAQYQYKVAIDEVLAKKTDQPWLNPKEWVFDPARTPKVKWEKELGGRFYQKKVTHVIKGQNKGAVRINFDSDKQLRSLIYDLYLKDRWKIISKELKSFRPEEPSTFKKQLEITFNDCVYEFDLTAQGLPPVDRNILKVLGEFGQLLFELNAVKKRQGYIQAYLNNIVDGRIHLRFRPISTLTGRAAGG